MIINSFGGSRYKPLLHLDMDKAKQLSGIKVWGFVGTTQAVLPLPHVDAEPGREECKGVVVNNTSTSSI